MFKKNFERICLDKGLKPTIVVREIGLSAATYSCWTDESVPRRSTLEKLANYLGVTPDDLLKDGTEQTPADGEAEQGSAYTVSAEEYRLILAWRTCPDAVRPAILQLLGVPDKAEARDVVS